MKKKQQKPATSNTYVKLTAVWGNDDAESSIKVSPSEWKGIQEGAEYDASAWSRYEGKRDSVEWHFAKGKVSVYGDDGDQPVDELPVDELIVQIVTPRNRGAT